MGFFEKEHDFEEIETWNKKSKNPKHKAYIDRNTGKYWISNDRNTEYLSPLDVNKHHIAKGWRTDGTYGDKTIKNNPTHSGSVCFIATAAYGTPFATEINALRYWRDEVLLTNSFGTLFVKTYYTLSPPVADFIREKPTLRKITRFILAPIVKLAQIWQDKKIKEI